MDSDMEWNGMEWTKHRPLSSIINIFPFGIHYFILIVSCYTNKDFHPLFAKIFVFYRVVCADTHKNSAYPHRDVLSFIPQNSGKQRDKIMAHYLISL